LVKTQFGFHIIKVNDKQEARLRPFDEMKEAIRPVVRARKGEDKANEISQQASVELVNSKDFDAVAKKFGAEVRSTPPIAQTDPIPEMGTATEFQRRLFTLNKDEIGTAIQVEKGFAIPMVTDVQASHPAMFEEVQTKVATDLKTDKAKDLAGAKVKQA